jgi:hypothetical protein
VIPAGSILEGAKPLASFKPSSGADLCRNNLQDCDFVHKLGWCSPLMIRSLHEEGRL